jgi:hypothetical protein
VLDQRVCRHSWMFGLALLAMTRNFWRSQ